MSAYDQSLCAGPLRGHLDFQQLSVSPGQTEIPADFHNQMLMWATLEEIKFKLEKCFINFKKTRDFVSITLINIISECHERSTNTTVDTIKDQPLPVYLPAGQAPLC